MFLMLFYTLLCFRMNSVFEEKGIKVKLIFQRVIMMTIFIICSVILLKHSFTLITFILLMIELLYLLVFPALFKIIYPLSSGILMNNMLFLISLGFIILHRLEANNALKQFLIVMAGSVMFFFVPVIIKKKKLTI